MKYLPYLLLLLFAPDLFAGPFNPPPTDQSVNLLGIVFGNAIGDLYLGGTANPVLSDIMEKFNFIIVVAGTCIVSYVAILSTINTAHEGTAMGKRWSAVWVPMRSVAGMALMVPAPATGYSMIQVTVMWIIIQGIGAADQLWNIALDGLKEGVSASAGGVIAPKLTGMGYDLAQQVLAAQVCMDALYQAATNPENINANNGNGNWISQNGQYVKNFSKPEDGYPKMTSTTSANRNATMQGWSYFGVNDGDPDHMAVCGQLRIVGNVSESLDYPKVGVAPSDATLLQEATDIYNGKLNAISTMLSVSQDLAQGIVNHTMAYPIPGAWGLFSLGVAPVPPPGYAVRMINAYGGAMSALVVPNTQVNSTSTTNGSQSDQINEIVDKGEQSGWVSAGSFYFIFNRTLQPTLFASAMDQIKPDPEKPSIPTCSYKDQQCFLSAGSNQGFPPNSDSIKNFDNVTMFSKTDFRNMANDLAQASLYLNADYITCNPGTDIPASCTGQTSNQLTFPSGIDNSELQGLAAAMAWGSTNIINEMYKNMNNYGNGDPLYNHAMFGRSLMLTVEIMFLTMIGLTIYLAMGAPAPFVGMAFAFLALVLLGLIAILSPFFGIIWGFGAMLAIYCPLIPYMIFTMGVIGWLMTVVEAIIAAPLIALGLVLPEGDELAKIHGALMILANIFLRPMLMILGFLLAGRVYKAATYLVDFGMAAVFQTINVSTIFSFVVVLSVYVGFIMSITNICFSLIYAIPDKILRWLGGQGEQTQAGNLEEVKGKAQAGAQMGGEAMQKLGGKTGEAGAGMGEKAVESQSRKAYMGGAQGPMTQGQSRLSTAAKGIGGMLGKFLGGKGGK